MSDDNSIATGDLTTLGHFVAKMTRLVERQTGDEAGLLTEAKSALADLLEHDDWLDDEFTMPGEESYRQYLLYLDPLKRFSVVSFVWTPGQQTPIHDHLTWGLVGVLRGSEVSESFELSDDGPVSAGETIMSVGDIAMVSPSIGDVHRVRSAYAYGPSVSIHVYGGDIGAIERHAFATDGTVRKFVSGYSNRLLPALRRM